MTLDQITGPLRAIAPMLTAVAVGKGWISAGSADWLIVSIVTLISAGWSIWTNRPASMAATVQALPGVNVQTTTAAPESVKTAVADAKKSN